MMLLGSFSFDGEEKCQMIIVVVTKGCHIEAELSRSHSGEECFILEVKL